MKTKTILRKTETFGPSLLLITVAAILMSLSVAKSNAQVNFSGTWVLNETKSSPVEGGFRFAPTTINITHNGNELSVQSTMQGPDGDFTFNSKYTLDGKECSNVLFQENVRKSVVQWSADKKSLTFTHTMNFNGNEFKSTETWTLNETDKTLAIENVFNTPNGEMRMTNVYDKK
ncbi:MAG: hypothetical protein WBJ37_11130 [Bacteroidales bacterium]